MNSLQSDHSVEAIKARLESMEQGGAHPHIKDFIYGAVDGAVTTFAVVTGVAGAGLSSTVIVILGVANLVADGFSMAVGNYLGTKAERQLRDKIRKTEEQHIALYPEGEREEIRQIFQKKGFEGDDLERAVDTITSDKQRWIDTMLSEEFGLSNIEPNPFRAAFATFVAFVIFGSIPILTFVINALTPFTIPHPFLWSSILTLMTFFVVGATKSMVVKDRWYISGLETLLVGGSAALLAYIIGYYLGHLL